MTARPAPGSSPAPPAATAPGNDPGPAGGPPPPPPSLGKQLAWALLILVSVFLFTRYGGRHTGSVEWGYRILFAAPAFLGFFLVRVRRLRWAVGAILCACITISYLDRNTMGLAVTAIRDSGDIPISDGDFANLVSAFLFAYALMYVGGGRLMDVLGTRRGFLVVTLFWSFAVISHGFAGGIVALLVSRVLLGIGEGGGFPGITKAVAEWFPVRERSTAMGLINGGTAIGGMVAPPLAAVVLSYAYWPGSPAGGDAFPWRWVFFLSGSLGFVWCLWWFWLYHPAAQHPRLSAAEREELREVIATPQGQASSDGADIPWLRLFTYRAVWALMLCKFLGDAVWYFIANWLPKYLIDARGYDIKGMAAFAWMPWAGAGIGCIVVGYFSSWLITRGFSINASRKIALGIAVAVMPTLFLVPYIESNAWVIVPFIIGYFGQQAWSTLVMTLPTDLFPRAAVGSVAGLVGFGGAIGGIVFNKLGGFWLDAHPMASFTASQRWGPIFFFAGILHIVSFIVILVLIPKIRMLERRSQPAAA
ncbi:MAG: MFS transporter [Gemmatimonadetes bacterium]|nr:MFS transporter [Gemmatimonadota bacterium]